MPSRLQFAALFCLVLMAAATTAHPAEIIVSAANYAETPPDVLDRLFRHPADLPDAPPPAVPERPVRYYQFLPGESLESDLSYTEVCKLLVPALASKNLVNTFDQTKVSLILRITFGGRPWRDPFVRAGDLEWKHGLVPRRRNRAALGAQAAWDERAGGDEAALYQTERDLADLDPTNGAEGMADRLIGGLHTEDYFLVVVDAFDVAMLRAKGNSAPRAWTTFIAVPRQKGMKFSTIAAHMIAKAAPFFGETLAGKARFTDREGIVKPGELRVIERDVPAQHK